MAVVVDALVILLLMAAIVLGGSIVLYWTYRRARSKGYRPPGAALILLIGCVAGVLGTVALNPQYTNSLPLFLWRFFWIPLLLAAAGLVLTVLVLPRRTARVFGERRVHFPFRALSWLAKISAVVLVLLVALAWLTKAATLTTMVQTAAFGVALWSAGQYLIRQARDLHALPAEEVIQEDSRPPVLYLRAFNQESEFFVMGIKSVYGKWAKSFSSAIASDYQKIGLTVEEYLGQELHDSIGPFVALGSPEDYLAPPGALRIYAKDDEWKTRFDELARRAACVIVEVSKSDNLRWEFEHLRLEGLQEKLFVLTRPSTEGSRISWKFWEMLWLVKGIRAMTWPEFASDLKKLGYQINFGDPGAGAVLGFDASGGGFVLTTDGNWPNDFVEPIQAWISERRKAGRCVDAKCAKCGREMYVSLDETEPLCFDCRSGTSETSRAWRRVGWLMGGVLLVVVPLVLTMAVGVLMPEAWVDRWIGWVFPVLLILTVVVGVYWSRRKKQSQER